MAKVFQKPGNVAELLARVKVLEQRYPGAGFHRYLDVVPTVEEGAMVFPSTTLVGDVRLAKGVSIWFGSVLRGDINFIDVRCARVAQWNC